MADPVLVKIAHPGHKHLYYTGKDKDGKPVVEKYYMADIDAAEALAKFPDQYSLKPPKDAGSVVDKSPPDPLAVIRATNEANATGAAAPAAAPAAK